MEIVKKVKILFLVTQSEMGGAQRYVFEIARGLDPKNYEILVAAGQGDGELFQKLITIGVEPRRLKQMKRTPWPWQITSAIGEIRNLLTKEKPDVLFLCSTTAGLLGSLASFLYKIQNTKYKIQVIYRIGGWAFRDPRACWKNWLVLLAEKLTAPLKDKIIVNCEIDRKLALKYKIAPESKIVKIYNGINADSLEFFSKEESRQKLSIENGPVVGTVANFYKTKGLEYLIEAAEEVNARFVIIGEGRLRPKLEALIKQYRLQEKVILTGRIPDAYKYLKAFDIFVLPSLKEGFPWIILEAMAAAVPIVTTNVGALPEIIDDGLNGCLAKPSNSQMLAEKIKWLLEHPQEAQVMGIQAKTKLVKEFSLQRMIEETEKLLS